MHIPPLEPYSQGWGEFSSADLPLPPTPIPLPRPILPPKLDPETLSKLDLDSRIEMLLSDMSSQCSNVEPALLSTVKTNSNSIEDNKDNPNVNPHLSPGNNDNDSNLNEKEILPPLSDPPSPFLSKDIYINCFEKAAEQLKISKETNNFFNNSVRNGK